MHNKSYPHITFYHKKLNKLIFCLTIILFSLNESNSQQFNNWYFPLQNGITFNTNPPSFLAGSQLGTTPFGGQFTCASISDKNGKLLFSSDGMKVWDRNNNQMPNGFDLLGRNAKLNGVLIVPFINEPNKYYLFTGEGYLGTSSRPDTLKYCYTVVDMNANNELGDVVIKNAFIRNFSAEKMVAIPHANGTDIWWICRDWTNNFYSYKITCNGIDTSKKVTSIIGNNINNNVNLIFSDIKASNDGKMIAACYRDYFELYKFDNTTGLLSNSIKITDQNTTLSFYGVEFSPNNKLLYITQRIDYLTFGGITQYNLASYDSLSINNSRVLLANISDAGLQLGPDNKIYFANGTPKVGRIEFPNVLGIGCLVKDSIVLLQNVTRRRLPYSYVNLITAQNVQIPTYTVANDCRTVTLTGKTYIKGNNLTFKWKFGDGDSTVQIVPSMGDTTFTSVTHFFPLGTDTFNVQLFVTSDTVCGQASAGKKVVLPLSYFGEAKFGVQTNCGDLLVNFNDSSILSNNNSAAFNYQWQFLNKNNVVLGTAFQPNASFVYPNYDTVKARLIVTPNILSNCSKSDTLEKVFVLSTKPIAAFSNGLVCLGKQVSFLNESNNAVGAIVNSEWLVGNGVVSNNNTGFDYTFNQGGNYLVSLKVATANGCSTTLTKTIVVEPAIANAGKDTIVREGEPFVLNGTGGITYVWQPPIGLDDVNKANPIGILNNSQQYNVKITTAQGCVGFDTVMITVLRNLKIPNAFSPNGDGVNETWNIEQLKDYPTAEIQIFNRNGQLLYNAKGNNINAWNGTINNKPVPVGTYYYVITLNNQLRNKPFTGWVLVVR